MVNLNQSNKNSNRLARAALRGNQLNAERSAARNSEPILQFNNLVNRKIRNPFAAHNFCEFMTTSSAAVIVETAFVIGPTLILILGLVQLGIIYFAQAIFDVGAQEFFQSVTYSFESTNTAQDGYDWLCAFLQRSNFLLCTEFDGKKRLYVDVRDLSSVENRTDVLYVDDDGSFGGTAEGFGDDANFWNIPTADAAGVGQTRVIRTFFLLPVPWNRFLADWANVRGEGQALVRGAIYGKPAITGIPAFIGGVPNLP